VRLTAIEIRNLWKHFRLYSDPALTLKERAIFWRRNRTEDFAALKDINLEVPRGTTVGIIGRNGSGKSTLLKIISRILYPSRGKVEVHGRVSTLLELGAGFHPDFTGRENIFLNASILGFTRKETKERLGEIIQFAELGAFIDNPVRNYSSGMYMRLGFAVAVHVDPDILLIDEVLAVGDLPFQQKCLERIRDFRKESRTIVFVTHSLAMVESLCDVVVWLDQGAIRLQGEPQQVAHAYREGVSSSP